MIRTKKVTCIVILVLAFSNLYSQEGMPSDICITLPAEQRSMVSALSGATKLDGKNTLKRRWTGTEKMLARNYLRARLVDIGLAAQEQTYKVNLAHVKPSRNPMRGTNLFATIPASTASTEYIIIGAHYDTVSESPGAMDNATGCALVYSVSKLVGEMPVRKKNLFVVFFDQEEVGHAGSYAFANYAREKDLDIHSAHTFDMIGWDSDGDKSIELELPTRELETLYRKHAQSLGIVAYTTETSETDHREFRNAGFSAIGVGGEYKHGDTTPHHHLPTDTVDTVNFDYLAFVTLLTYKAIEELIVD